MKEKLSLTKNSSQNQEVFKKNCGDDGNFVSISAMTISYMIIALFNAAYIETTGVALSFMWLIFWWVIIATNISSFYYSIKNKEI